MVRFRELRSKLRTNFIDFYYHPYCAVCDYPVQPPLPSPLVCRDCLATLPFRMDRERMTWDKPWPLLATFFYRDPIPRLIVSMKFSERADIAEAIAPFMCRTIKRHAVGFDAIIPIPLHKKRLAERGYNQAALLAKMISIESGITVVDDLLYRSVHTERQSESRSVAERHRHLADAFQVNARAPVLEELRGRPVLLIDDVLTTGATLAAAAKPLDEAGLRVTCLVASSDKEKYLNYEDVLHRWM